MYAAVTSPAVTITFAAGTAPSAADASLYTAARTAIHSADPGASVIVGGLADDSQSFSADRDYPAQYVEQMFAADPTRIID